MGPSEAGVASVLNTPVRIHSLSPGGVSEGPWRGRWNIRLMQGPLPRIWTAEGESPPD